MHSRATSLSTDHTATRILTDLHAVASPSRPYSPRCPSPSEPRAGAVSTQTGSLPSPASRGDAVSHRIRGRFDARDGRVGGRLGRHTILLVVVFRHRDVNAFDG